MITARAQRPGRIPRRVIATVVVVLVAMLLPAGVAAAQPSPPPPPATSSAPCVGQDCLPQPTAAPVSPPTAPQEPGGTGNGDSGSWIGNLLNGWLQSFFATLVRSALNPLLDLLSQYVLVTPQLDQLPIMGQLWGNSQQIMIAVYAILVLVAGVTVMAYETLQAQHSIREILPRLAVGFLAANLSLFLGAKAIEIANALSQAVLGDQVNPDLAAQSLRATLESQLTPDQGSMFLLLIGLGLAVMLIAVLLTFIVRLTLTVLLLAAAPLLLMCHALPQTEGIAFWWWKAFAGVLAIQIGQSLTLTAAIKLFFLPGGITIFN